MNSIRYISGIAALASLLGTGINAQAQTSQANPRKENVQVDRYGAITPLTVIIRDSDGTERKNPLHALHIPAFATVGGKDAEHGAPVGATTSQTVCFDGMFGPDGRGKPTKIYVKVAPGTTDGNLHIDSNGCISPQSNSAFVGDRPYRTATLDVTGVGDSRTTPGGKITTDSIKVNYFVVVDSSKLKTRNEGLETKLGEVTREFQSYVSQKESEIHQYKTEIDLLQKQIDSSNQLNLTLRGLIDRLFGDLDKRSSEIIEAQKKYEAKLAELSAQENQVIGLASFGAGAGNSHVDYGKGAHGVSVVDTNDKVYSGKLAAAAKRGYFELAVQSRKQNGTITPNGKFHRDSSTLSAHGGVRLFDIGTHASIAAGVETTILNGTDTGYINPQNSTNPRDRIPTDGSGSVTSVLGEAGLAFHGNNYVVFVYGDFGKNMTEGNMLSGASARFLVYGNRGTASGSFNYRNAEHVPGSVSGSSMHADLQAGPKIPKIFGGRIVPVVGVAIDKNVQGSSFGAYGGIGIKLGPVSHK